METTEQITPTQKLTAFIDICREITKDHHLPSNMVEQFNNDLNFNEIKDRESFIKGMAYASIIYEGHKSMIEKDKEYTDYPILETIIGFVTRDEIN